jgi:hypothetical protein
VQPDIGDAWDNPLLPIWGVDDPRLDGTGLYGAIGLLRVREDSRLGFALDRPLALIYDIEYRKEDQRIHTRNRP